MAIEFEGDDCLDHIRDGDTLVMTRLDHLAGSTLDLRRIAKRLQLARGNRQVIDQNIDTSDATGRLLLNMLGAIAQFETESRVKQTASARPKRTACGLAPLTSCRPIRPASCGSAARMAFSIRD